MRSPDMIQINRLRGMILTYETSITCNEAVIRHARRMISILRGEIDAIESRKGRNSPGKISG